MLALLDAILPVRNDTPLPAGLLALFGCAGLSTPPNKCSGDRLMLCLAKAFLLFDKIVFEHDRRSHMLLRHNDIISLSYADWTQFARSTGVTTFNPETCAAIRRNSWRLLVTSVAPICLAVSAISKSFIGPGRSLNPKPSP